MEEGRKWEWEGVTDAGDVVSAGGVVRCWLPGDHNSLLQDARNRGKRTTDHFGDYLDTIPGNIPPQPEKKQ